MSQQVTLHSLLSSLSPSLSDSPGVKTALNMVSHSRQEIAASPILSTDRKGGSEKCLWRETHSLSHVRCSLDFFLI